MKRNRLAICDPEQEYAYRLMEALSRKEDFPYEILTFTSVDRLYTGLTERPAQLLLIAQSVFREEMKNWPAEQIVVLCESETFPETDVSAISKYSSVTKIRKKMMEMAAASGNLPPSAKIDRPVRLLGIYSPVKRCLQTTFAFVLGQFLARSHNVLYLNFESYAGLDSMLSRSFETDFSNLLYYLQDSPETLQNRLYQMTENINGMDMIPPAFSGFDIFRMRWEEWERLFETLESSKYEYVILDLSDGVQGLFEMLRRCSRIYTIVREDGFAQAKCRQYEDILRKADYADVLEKTKKVQIPVLKRLPRDLNHLTNCELEEFVERLVKEDEQSRV